MSNSSYKLFKFFEVAEVNPRRDSNLRDLSDQTEVTFVPMASVDEISGAISKPIIESLGKVKKGFTPFAENDVIFAKITPCMQNGKSAIARNLMNGLGFGSTEFHVLRPSKRVLPEWIWYFVRQLSFRKDAQGSFRGSAGQQRVPADFLENYEIPVPSYEEQERVISRLSELFDRTGEIQVLRNCMFNETQVLLGAIIEDIFREAGGNEVCLENVAAIEGKLVDPREAAYKNLLHVGGANIVSETGELIDMLTAEEEKLISGKFFFNDKDVLYSKIRPYLKKVARPDFTGLCSADMYPLRPAEGRLHRDYLFYLLLSRDFTNYAIKVSNRAGMPKVNREQLFAYRFNLPSYQKQLDVIEKLNESMQAILAMVAEMKEAVSETDFIQQSILKKAFAGEL